MAYGTTALDCTSTSPHHAYRTVIATLLFQQLLSAFNPRSVADPTEGSGTLGTICREYGVAYYGLDLATGFDLVRQPLRDALPTLVDLVFLHPPYYRILPYSGVAWGAVPDCRDLSLVRNWDRYLVRLLAMIKNAATAVAPNGHLVVLLGDVRVAGCIYQPGPALALQLGELRLIELPAHRPDRSAIHPVVREYGVVIDVTLGASSFHSVVRREVTHG